MSPDRVPVVTSCRIGFEIQHSQMPVKVPNSLLVVASFVLLCQPLGAMPKDVFGKPWDSPYIDVETGCLWKVIAPVPYRMVPTVLSWRSKPVLSKVLSDGSRILARHRLSLLGQWMETGIENRYVGFMAAPSLEWWNKDATWSVYGGIGGGVGCIDSQGVIGGQGQDRTLNWFGTLGASRPLAGNTEIRLGALFQHLSNGGATDPNVGLNSVGFTAGISWGF